MAKTRKIIRKSIFTFLQNYQYFTSTPTLLAFPYAATYLLTQSLIIPSLSSYLFHQLIHGRLINSSSPQLFATLNLNLSQITILITFLFVSPFTFSFLLLPARASVIIKALNVDGHKELAFSSWTSHLNPILITQLCNSLVMFAANATCFVFLALCFNLLDVFGLSSSRGALLFLSATGALIYSIVLANSYIICNLALVSSGMENRGGFVSILKACVMIQGRTATALSLAVAINMALAAIEALFQYRVVRSFRGNFASNSCLLLVMEGIFIACLYGVCLVFDTVVGCTFWRWCKKDDQIDQVEMFFHQI